MKKTLKKFRGMLENRRPSFATIFMVLLLLGIALEVRALLAQKDSASVAAGNSLEASAEKVVATCAARNYRPTCYEEEVSKLMDHISMEQAFEVTRLVQDKDPSYAYCHVLGHKLSSRETAKDPSLWKEVVARCPSGLCSNGCIHGAFQERFRADVLNDREIQRLMPDIDNVCEEKSTWHPTGLEQATCYHALGHLLMYITGADIEKATALCDKIAVRSDGRNFAQLCYDGTFMQIFQPLEPEDFALIKGKEVKKEDLPSFCGKFSGGKRGPCWNEGWPLYRDEILSPKGVVKFCSQSFLKDQADISRCYMAMFYVAPAQFQFDGNKMKSFCAALPDDVGSQCFANAASRLIETDYRNIDRSVGLCQGIASIKAKDACFKELLFYSKYNFHPGSAEFLKICSELPEPFRSQCLAR